MAIYRGVKITKLLDLYTFDVGTKKEYATCLRFSMFLIDLHKEGKL